MRKNILIPTDLTIESLMLVKHSIIKGSNEELKIILIYCSMLPDSITELLFYSPHKVLQKYTSKDFLTACSILQNKYPERVKGVSLKIFHGKSQSAFNYFAESEAITEAYLPVSYKLKLRDNAFDPTVLIRSSNLTVHEVDWAVKTSLPEKDKLAELF